MARRTLWQLLIAAALLALLGTLATLQYRWLGDVSEAERERLRASLRTRAVTVAGGIDRELANVFVAFQVDSVKLDADPGGALADAYSSVRRTSAAPAIVQSVYLLDAASDKPWTLEQLDPDRRVVRQADWPEPLAAWHRHAALAGNRDPGVAMPPLAFADTLGSQTPALFVAIPRIHRIENGGRLAVLPDLNALVRIVIVLLDPSALRHQLVEPFVTREFGAGDAAQYYVAIVRHGDRPDVVYASDPGVPLDAGTADVSVPLFALHPDEIRNLAAGDAGYVATNSPKMSITIVRRASGAAGTRVLTTTGSDAAWQLLIRCKAGSLEALVATSRHRNLAISLGVLTLLAGSFMLIIVSARRQQRLALQQMEFVAAVSHELRTPLAVICSAGENLADGVVADTAQVKRYGSLIETEGRRLGDMVERVMQFAGISSGAPRHMRPDVDMARVIADAVTGVSAEARERGVSVEVHANGGLPAVTGDPDALRSAVQNIVGNAVKYSAAGSVVDATARAIEGRVQIQVADTGLGIDAADLPHIFEPFYRGRRAVDAQVRGSGVGLSVVRHVIETHHGTIDVDSRAGEGTVVTVELLPHRLHRLDTSSPAALS